MITDFLLDHRPLVPVALVVLLVFCVGVGYLLLRADRTGRRIAAALAGLSAAGVVALTLVPASRRLDHVVCTVQFALPALGRVELLANTALFVPLVFFATLATRRPWPVLVAGSASSAVIEAIQALVPAIGRACDTNDWFMNTLGVIAGVLLAVGTKALVSAVSRR